METVLVSSYRSAQRLSRNLSEPGVGRYRTAGRPNGDGLPQCHPHAEVGSGVGPHKAGIYCGRPDVQFYRGCGSHPVPGMARISARPDETSAAEARQTAEGATGGGAGSPGRVEPGQPGPGAYILSCRVPT